MGRKELWLYEDCQRLDVKTGGFKYTSVSD